MNQQDKEFEKFGKMLNELISLTNIAGLPQDSLLLEDFVQFIRICKQNFLTKYRANRFNDWSFGKFVWEDFRRSLITENTDSQIKKVFTQFCNHIYCGFPPREQFSIGKLALHIEEPPRSEEIIVYRFGEWSKKININSFILYFEAELKPALVKKIKSFENKNKKLESAVLWKLIKTTNPKIVGMSFEEIERYFQIKTRIKK